MPRPSKVKSAQPLTTAQPKIDPLDSLRFPLRELGDRDRVDIIMTNPPFGGEKERGILGNFPEDKQTSETALLFLQLIMRKLRRPGSPSPEGRRPDQGRAAQRLQPSHECTSAQWRVRPVHQHPDESSFLRPLSSDRRSLGIGWVLV